jgi:hypothetical protein
MYLRVLSVSILGMGTGQLTMWVVKNIVIIITEGLVNCKQRLL